MKLFIKVSYVETFYEDFIETDTFPCSIGREPTAKITLMGQDISRQHAEIVEENGELRLRDVGSRTGIWHGGKVVKEIKITEGLQLRMGAALLNFSLIRFPMEQTLSFGHEEHVVSHEPALKKIEGWLEGRVVYALFFILLALAYFTAPDLYRKGDYAKSLALSLLTTTFIAPTLITILIVTFRKINRGDYAWNRSLCLAYILCIVGEAAELFESAFCWFKTFSFTWNSIVFSILMMSVFFFWWFLAVGRNLTMRNRMVRALGLSVIVYALIAGVSLLATGYRAEYEIETCDSLTGWHWGEGESLSSVEDFLTKSAKELTK